MQIRWNCITFSFQGSPSTGAAGESLFTASVSKRKYVVKGNIVRFDKVWSNVGNNYDPRSGVYTSPKDGAYHFSCTVMSQGKNGIRVNLWKNDVKTVAIYSYGAYGGTLNMALDLRRGDRVYIKQGHVENYIYAEPEYHFSMFSGFQIAWEILWSIYEYLYRKYHNKIFI